MDFKSKCIHSEGKKYDNVGSLSTPIFQTATFAHAGLINTGYDYSRVQNPTREQLENILTNLENAQDTLAFSSGMAAISCLMELFSAGDHIIIGDDLYGGSNRLFEHISRKNGIAFSVVDTSEISEIEEKITPLTKAIFVETPSNPLMKVSDISGIAELAKRHRILTIVDNTFLTPYFQKPIDLGADIIIHSGTKYLGGHNDTLAGFLSVNTVELSEKLRFIYKTTGACLAPFDSWLIIRGIKTLAIRMERQTENAIIIANWLVNNQKVHRVYYTGLESHPDYELSKRQTTGFGAMISFEVDNKETAEKILKNVRLITYAESLGGVETLITYPMLQTHADIPEALREAKGINDRLLRLSVGIEDVKDIIEELEQVFEFSQAR